MGIYRVLVERGQVVPVPLNPENMNPMLDTGCLHRVEVVSGAWSWSSKPEVADVDDDLNADRCGGGDDLFSELIIPMPVTGDGDSLWLRG